MSYIFVAHKVEYERYNDDKYSKIICVAQTLEEFWDCLTKERAYADVVVMYAPGKMITVTHFHGQSLDNLKHSINCSLPAGYARV